jgi:zinc protease
VQPRRIVLEDDVNLPRIYMAWHSPAAFEDDDAALDVASGILGYGRASRLYRSLVYERQIAQSVSVFQNSGVLGSTFRVVATARPGVSLDQLEALVREEIAAVADRGVLERELERSRNSVETAFIDGLQNVGGFGGRADQLNMYLFHTGEPDFVEQDLARYRRLSAPDVRDAVRRHLQEPACVLSVVPRPPA